MAVDTVEASPPPRVRSLTLADLKGALADGWADFRAAPKYGVFFGAVYALGGALIFSELLMQGRSLWIIPFAFAFPLIGPFIAVGLYEVSRRRAAGEPLSWTEVLGVIRRERSRQIPFMAVVVLGGAMVWLWSARLIAALTIGRMTGARYSDLGAILSTPEGMTMVVVGTLVGGVIALILFSVTVLSLPMLLDREVDPVTAMIASVSAVRRYPRPMLTWAAIVGVVLIIAMLPAFLGLIVALPVLGHATWHLYRRAIA